MPARNSEHRYYTSPNQRVVHINREPVVSDFLGIKNENWMRAARDLSAHSLKLYLYLAANRNDFDLALSPEAIRQAIGMPRSTYHDQFHILVDKGYLVENCGNLYDFYEVPIKDKDIQRTLCHDAHENTSDGFVCSQESIEHSQEDIQINKEIILNNNINIKKTTGEEKFKF